MHLWALSSVLLALAAIALAGLSLEDTKSDSLQSAVDAVSRRQRDIATGKQFFGLGSYREGADDLTFLAQDTDSQTGDGQPENIGYGFQKSRNHHGFGEPQTDDDIENQERKLFENLAVEYLKEEFEKSDDANNRYYKVAGGEKRSAFRERELPERFLNVQGKLRSGFKKRTAFGPYLSTSFRERNEGDTDDENRRKIMKSVNRHLGQDLENFESGDDEEYAKLIQSLWERYRESDPNLEDTDELSENDVDTLIKYLGENSPGRKFSEDSDIKKRRNNVDGRSGAGYDFSDLLIQKRGRQMLDQNEPAANPFLYSLKFVAPESNREAVEQMREIEGLDASGENDGDIFRLGLKAIEDPDHRDDEEWHSSPRNEQDAEEYGQDFPPNFLSHADHSRKRFYQQESGMKRKRFPVAKRSPGFVNFGKGTVEFGKIRMKKSTQRESHTTDPKVASELSHIFEPPSNENTKLTPLIIGNHVVTKQKVTTSTTPASKTNSTEIEMTVIVNINKNVSAVEPSHINEEIEPPVAMSRLEAPIEIKKKSVDWTDYFGLDKRLKKTGYSAQTGGADGNVGSDKWLVKQYFKSAAAAGDQQRPLVSNQRNKKDVHLSVQPFDTRLYDENNLIAHQQIFKSKKDYTSEVDEARIEKIDTKLRNIEDVIINEAVKYTGAHEGSTDSKEVQDVKDKVISRLAAAYNLEKMRKALSEFKSSLLAQKMSKYNPENHGSHVEGEEKRSGPPKGSHSDDIKSNSGKNMKQAYSNNVSGVNGPQIENMSEGYMGGPKNLRNERYDNECPILGNVLKKCQDIEIGVGQSDYDFLSLCTLHQICYVCGPEVGSDSMNACDTMFMDKAEEMCSGGTFCEKSALLWIMALKRHQPGDVLGGATQCAEDFCTSQPVVHLER